MGDKECCVLCLNPVKLISTGSVVQKKKQNGRTRETARTAGCHNDNHCDDSLLENEIVGVFLVRKLLFVPQSTCEELLKAFGNPSGWLSTCDQCSEIVKKARGVHKEICRLERELERLRDDVKEKIVTSYKSRAQRTYGDVKELTESKDKRAVTVLRSLFLLQRATSVVIDENEEPVLKEEFPDNEVEFEDNGNVDVLSDTSGGHDDEPIPEPNSMTKILSEATELKNELAENVTCTSMSRYSRRLRNRLVRSQRSQRAPLTGQPSDSIYKCSHCYASFKTKDSRRMHLSKNHWIYQKGPLGLSQKESSKGRACPQCQKCFQSMDTFRQHCMDDHAMLSCDKCPRLFSSFRSLRNHRSILHKIQTVNENPIKRDPSTSKKSSLPIKSHVIQGIEIHQCVHCNYCNRRKTRVFTHMRTVHWSMYKPCRNSNDHKCSSNDLGGSTLLKCEKCPAEDETRFSSLDDLINHKVAAHEMIKCDQCSSVFIGLGYLENHQQVYHSAETADPSKWINLKMASQLSEASEAIREYKPPQCKFCQETFKRRSELREHNLRQHSSEMFKCEKCPELFDLLRHLYTHKTEVHNEPNAPYKCSQCDYTNMRYNQIHRHKRLMHEERTRFICEICSASFSSEKYLKFHKAQKHGEQKGNLNMHCDQCNRSFSTPFYLTRHVKTTHFGEWRYKCPLCDIGFMGQKQVNFHISVVHEKKRPFKCTQEGCDWTYAKQWQLNQHLQSVHGSNNLRCSTCNFETNDSRKLTNHKKIHNNGLFQCDLCGKSYTIYKCFLQHMRLTHKIRKPRGKIAELSPFVASFTKAGKSSASTEQEVGSASLDQDDEIRNDK